MVTHGGFDPLMLWLIPWMILIFVGVYVYTALCLRSIGRKLKYNRNWVAWVPFLNGILLLELGGFHWAFIFLLLVPVLGWLVLGVFTII